MRNFRKALADDISLQERLLVQYEKELRTLPTGILDESCSGKVVHYIDAKGKDHNSEKTKAVMIKISRRRLLEKKIHVIQENLKRQKKLYEKYISYTDENIMDKVARVYRKILLREKEKAEQAAEHEHSSSGGGEKTGHRSLTGKELDSKSEVIISMLLDVYGIKYYRGVKIYWPYGMSEEAERSWAELELPVYVVPDFVIILPSGEKIYWEHLGMLGDKKYSVRWMKKQVFYHWLGITQGVNLIVTADDCNGSIDPAAVADIIETKLAPLITKAKKN